MTMTHSVKSIQHLSVAWPKKSLLKLVGLALLARCVLAHG